MKKPRKILRNVYESYENISEKKVYNVKMK